VSVTNRRGTAQDSMMSAASGPVDSEPEAMARIPSESGSGSWAARADGAVPAWAATAISKYVTPC
jgi:hypothetical protein